MATTTERKWERVMARKGLPREERELLEHLRACLKGRLPDCPECLDRHVVQCDASGWKVCKCQLPT